MTRRTNHPAETLIARAPEYDAQLSMPRLGEAVEPADGGAVTPWWRAVDLPKQRAAPVEAPVETLPKALPWPID